MRNIILASRSPRRRELLIQMGFNPKIEESAVDEERFSFSSPADLVTKLSKAKAEAVSKNHRDAVIIGADTVVALDSEIMGKPKSSKHAKEMLKKLSGKTHDVITGFTILDTKTKKEFTKAVKTKVKVRKLTKAEIDQYVKTGLPMDRAGAYGIQDESSIVESISGDYFNVVGLPTDDVLNALKEFKI
jgi:septum formation protein